MSTLRAARDKWSQEMRLLALLAVAWVISANAALADSAPVLQPAPAEVAPPGTAPIVKLKQGGVYQSQGLAAPAAGEAVVYSIGEPTAEEQLYLEYINRARANPAAEAQRLRTSTNSDVLAAYNFFGVDLNLMASQFSGIAPTPPLSFNAQLIASARAHSLDMLTNAFQGHLGSDGGSPGDRMSDQGYNWSVWGENVYAAVKSVFHGHAAFEVDWGSGTGGMQNPPGHRQNIHYPSFREVGIGVVMGTNVGIGPQLVTQDFSSRFGLSPFITGVVHYDFNGNNFYDPGEGIQGVSVQVNNSPYYAVTANSGGYSVPVPGDGTYQVTFSGPSLVTTQKTVVVSGGANVKVDHAPVYQPPLISGPDPALLAQNNSYSFTPVGAASGYQWKQSKVALSSVFEGAEKGLSNVTTLVSPGYPVIVSNVKASGSNSFHLVHPQPTDQFLTLNQRVRPSQTSLVRFAGRLGWAGAGQVARLQASTNEGGAWLELWSLAGTGGGGQTTFTSYSKTLQTFAGQEVLLRFVYDYVSGGYYNQTGSGMGFYVDDITVTDAEELVEPVISDTASTAFTFNPTVATNYSLRVRSRVGDRWLDWGPSRLTYAIPAPLQTQIKGSPLISSNRIIINFELLNGSGGNFQIERATSVSGPWALDRSATIQPLSTSNLFRANAALGSGASAYYRIVGK